MSQQKQLVSNFLKKNQSAASKSASVPSGFQGIFEHKELEGGEQQQLKEALYPSIAPEEMERFEGDFALLCRTCSEVRSIQRQGVLLLGERISKTREILSHYSAGKKLLSQWMSFAFSSQKTAYNALAFYQLYSDLPTPQLKEKYKAMPARASYILASRNGDFEKKCAFIGSYSRQFARELIEEIQQVFPLSKNDQREEKSCLKEIGQVVATLKKLECRAGSFSFQESLSLRKVFEMSKKLEASLDKGIYEK